MNHSLSKAIILSTTDHGESDRLITFLTETTGKLTGIAKGARRSQRRFAHSLEPCSLVELRYRESRSYSLVWLEECKLLDAHMELRENLPRWGYAGLLIEIIKELVAERAPHEELFELTECTLNRLATDPDSLNVLVLSLIRLFQGLGYLSQLESCTYCQQPAVSRRTVVVAPGTRDSRLLPASFGWKRLLGGGLGDPGFAQGNQALPA